MKKALITGITGQDGSLSWQNFCLKKAMRFMVLSSRASVSNDSTHRSYYESRQHYDYMMGDLIRFHLTYHQIIVLQVTTG